MNERIIELANKANETVGFNFPLEESKQIHALMLNFAELIIKECGVALTPMLRDMVSRGQAYDLIKKHFGVEQ